MEITERIIAKANLSSQEAMVVRYYRKLPTAGKRTRKFVENLPSQKKSQLLRSAEEKIERTLSGQRAEG